MTTGLILVDIQNDYFPDGRMPLVGMDKACEKAKDLLSAFRKNRWPTFYIQHV
jgi:nicotinamidase-related amidase